MQTIREFSRKHNPSEVTMIKCTKCHTKLLHPITAHDRTQPAIDIPNKTDTPTCANSHKVKALVSDGNGRLIDVEVGGGFYVSFLSSTGHFKRRVDNVMVNFHRLPARHIWL